MTKKTAASFDRQQAVKNALRQFLTHDRSEAASPQNMANAILDRAFSGVNEGAFRFPTGVKIERKSDSN